MRRTRDRKPTPLGELVPNILGKLTGKHQPTAEEISAVWRRIAGRQAAQHSWPRRLVNRSLTVEVENSGWMYTLGLKKGELLQGLIEVMGGTLAKRLTLRMGERRDAES